ncbi:MAG: DUF222 domain-containing protein [Acidimicrobiia bacterium]|nr:DUF222 domain-containing protein [Acidimicrobiia bacterium]
MMVGCGGGIDVKAIVASLASVAPSSLDDDEIKALMLDGERLVNALHAFSAALVEEFDRRGTWSEDGSLSGSGWAAERTGSPKRSLRARARAGRVLRMLPTTQAPAREGRLSPEHLGALAACERQHPALACRDEELLVSQALAVDADAFRTVARHWTDRASDTYAAEPSHGPEPTDELHLSQTFEGRWELRGSFGPETGASVSAALEAHLDRQLRARRDGDPSVGLVASQLRAAAMVDLLCQTMRKEPSAESVPDRYRVGLVIRWDELTQAAEASCDAALYRVLVGAEGEVLDVGRQTSRWPTGIRRAITCRDDGCVFPGCDRPPSWCDVHHCQEWEHGGRTSVDNGVLLCRRHHTFIHRKRWRITIENGRPITRRDNGAEHVIIRWSSE